MDTPARGHRVRHQELDVPEELLDIPISDWLKSHMTHLRLVGLPTGSNPVLLLLYQKYRRAVARGLRASRAG